MLPAVKQRTPVPPRLFSQSAFQMASAKRTAFFPDMSFGWNYFRETRRKLPEMRHELLSAAHGADEIPVHNVFFILPLFFRDVWVAWNPKP